MDHKIVLCLITIAALVISGCINTENGAQGGRVASISTETTKTVVADTVATRYYTRINTDTRADEKNLSPLITTRPRLSRLYEPNPRFKKLKVGETALISAETTGTFVQGEQIYRLTAEKFPHAKVAWD